MIRGTDFILNPDKLEEQFQLVEVSEWIDYNTKEKLGFYYTVLFPKLKFEKIKVGVKNANQLVSNEELEQRGQVTVTDDILQDLTQENVVFQKEYTRQVYDTKSIITNGSPLKDSSVTYLKIKKGRDCTG